jgi:hypothetical protein
MINPVISEAEWKKCKADDLPELDVEKDTWMAIDLSPDRKHAHSLPVKGSIPISFMVSLLHTWFNPVNLDDKKWLTILLSGCASFQLMQVAYSKSTASAVAARLAPAGIPNPREFSGVSAIMR